MSPQLSDARPSILRLRLEPQVTTLIVADGDVVLAVGWQMLIARYLRHSPPTPGEIEEAIAVIEDEVMRVHKQVPAGARLHGDDPALDEIARLAGVQADGIVAVDAVERLFERLAAVSLGRPAAVEGLPTEPAFAARVLILRELMHHLKCTGLLVGRGPA